MRLYQRRPSPRESSHFCRARRRLGRLGIFPRLLAGRGRVAAARRTARGLAIEETLRMCTAASGAGTGRSGRTDSTPHASGATETRSNPTDVRRSVSSRASTLRSRCVLPTIQTSGRVLRVPCPSYRRRRFAAVRPPSGRRPAAANHGIVRRKPLRAARGPRRRQSDTVDVQRTTDGLGTGTSTNTSDCMNNTRCRPAKHTRRTEVSRL